MQLSPLFVLEDGCEEALYTTVKAANQCVISTVLHCHKLRGRGGHMHLKEAGVDFGLCSALFRILKSQKEIYFQEGHEVWIWEEKTAAIIFLFLELITYTFYMFSKIKWLAKVHWKLVAELEN